MNDALPPDEVLALPTRRLGRSVWVYERIDSTNTKALALASDPSHDGLVVVAREQTAGRGQYGRSWQASAGSSVLLSVILFPPPSLRRPALLTTWAATAVSEMVLRVTGRETLIKWPNDVFLDGKKICGILIEQRNTGAGDHPLAAVAGIGLNVNQGSQEFLGAGLTLAGSLASQTGRRFCADEVARVLIGELDEQYERLLRGEVAVLEESWGRRLGLLGQPVRVEGLQRDYHGRLAGVSFAGVEIECDGGATVTLAPEEVRHIVARGLCLPGLAVRG